MAKLQVAKVKNHVDLRLPEHRVIAILISNLEYVFVSEQEPVHHPVEHSPFVEVIRSTNLVLRSKLVLFAEKATPVNERR